MKAAVAALLVGMLPAAAAAQDSAAAVQTSGPMVVQQVHTTFMVAPDFKISRMDGRTARIAGLYGGWVLDQQWLIGAGGYWLTNGSSGRGLAYGGGVFGWTSSVDGPIAFSARSLVGWGEAHLTDSILMPQIEFPNDFFDHFGPNGMFRPGGMGAPVLTARNYQVRFHEQFFVAEPQADVTFRIASWGRLDAGAGYRAIGAGHGNERRLRGATASISFQVGNF